MASPGTHNNSKRSQRGARGALLRLLKARRLEEVTGSTNHNDADPSARQNLLNSLFDSKVLLTSSPIALDEVVGVFITRTTVLSNAELISNLSSIQWVVDAGDQAKVKEVWSADSFTSTLSGSGDIDSERFGDYMRSLVLVELERDPLRGNLPSTLLDIPLASLSSEVMDEFALVYWDPFLFKADAFRQYSGALQPLSVCEAVVESSVSTATGATFDNDTVCFQTRESPLLMSNAQPFTMGIAMFKGRLVGLATRSHQSRDGKLVQAVISVASESHRQFLSQIPHIKWDRETQLAPDWSAFQVIPIQFYQDGGGQVGCSGVPIAPTFALTAASCLCAFKTMGVICKGVRSSVKLTRYHPDFDLSSTRNTAEVDVALLELSSEVTASIVLSTENWKLVGTELIRMELSTTPTIEWVKTLEAEQCDDGTGLVSLSSPGVWAGIASGFSDGLNEGKLETPEDMVGMFPIESETSEGTMPPSVSASPKSLRLPPAAALFTNSCNTTTLIGFQVRGSNRYIGILYIPDCAPHSCKREKYRAGY